MYKERPKIDAEQQWIETGKAFLALFIAEPEFARKAVEIARRSPRLTCKHATIIRELQLVSDLMVTIKRRIEEIALDMRKYPLRHASLALSWLAMQRLYD